MLEIARPFGLGDGSSGLTRFEIDTRFLHFALKDRRLSMKSESFVLSFGFPLSCANG